MILSHCFKFRNLILSAVLIVGLGDVTHATAAQEHSFLVDLNSKTVTDLGSLFGRDTHALAINDAGQVVGYSATEGGNRAFITGPNGVGMRGLGALVAEGINDAGQVVGQLEPIGNLSHAFITGPDGGGMMDLNSVVNLPPGVFLTHAVGINNNGQVIAVGVIPEPETYALMLLGLGMIGFMIRGRKT